MEYNTARNLISMKEYGRHIQRMVEYTLTVEDEEKRNQHAKIIIDLMGFLNPHLKNVEDFRHMLWDHLFFISDFKLDVKSPYPIPDKATYKIKSDPLPYPKKYPKYNHLGKNLELVIDKALAEQDQEKRNGFANFIAYYMKVSYSNWHRETVHDDAIRREMNTITNGELEFVNTPSFKSRTPNFERNEYPRNEGRRKQNFGGRDSRNAGGGAREGRNNSGPRNNKPPARDKRNNAGGSGPRENRGFKPRF